MQEEVEQKSITLVISSAKMSGRIMKEAITKYLEHNRAKKAGKEVRYSGKQSVKRLVGQNQGVSNIELDDPEIRKFERIARRYGVDYAVKKVKGDKPRYMIFFKARDADALQAALSEYAERKVKTQDKPSLIQRLKSLKDRAAVLVPNRERHKSKVQSR